jgi:copper chaperone CopZ
LRNVVRHLLILSCHYAALAEKVPASMVGKSLPHYYNCEMVTTAKINGMSCSHCVRAVFTSLSGVPGISRADVSIGQAVIEHDGSVSPEAIREAISIAGYEVAEFRDDRRTLPVV